MDFLRRLFGDTLDPEPEPQSRQRQAPGPVRQDRSDLTEDERALERYRYLLRTAPPETLEAAHAEAFAQLTPEQRRMVLEELSQDLPERERAAVAGADEDPRALARVATRAEMRQPGTLERRFSGMGGPGMGGAGIGLGGMMAGSFLSTIAGVVIGTAIADAIFDGGEGDQGSAEGTDAEADQGTETGDAGFDSGDTGFDSGGDFGGGDFGGGDFGGGEF